MRAIVKDFKVVQDVCLDIDGITVISGKNNNGKSSMFEAIRSACLGRLGDGFVRTGQSGCSVRLEDGEDKLRWERVGKDTVFYVNDKEITKTKGKPPEEYVKALKIYDIEFPKFSLSPNFACQFEQLFLVGNGPVEAAAALSFLFSGDKFPELLKSISKSVKDDRDKLAVLEGSRTQLVDDLKALEVKLAGMDKVKEVFGLRSVLEAGALLLGSMERKIAEGEGLSLEISTIWDKATSIEFKLKEHYKGVSENDLTRILKLEVALQQGESLLKEKENKKTELSKLAEVYNIYKDVADVDFARLADMEKRIALGESLLKAVMESYKAIERNSVEWVRVSDELDATMALVSECPYCGQGLEEGSKVHLLAHI